VAGVADPVEVASGTDDVQAYTGQCRLLGWSFREDAGTPAVATVRLFDGLDNTGTLIAAIELAESGSDHEWYGPQGVWVKVGVFVEKVAGTSEGSVYTG